MKAKASDVRARLWGKPTPAQQVSNTEWKDQLIEQQVASVNLRERARHRKPDDHWRGLVKGLLIMHEVSLTRLRSRDRNEHVAMVRAEVARALRGHRWSWDRIGELLERDHTTIRAIVENHNDEDQ